MDARIDERSGDDGPELREIDILVPEKLDLDRGSNTEDGSARGSGLQFSRDGELGYDRLQGVGGVARGRDDAHGALDRWDRDHGPRIRAHLVRQSRHAYVLGRSLAERGIRLLFSVFRTVDGPTLVGDDGEIRGGRGAASYAVGLREPQQGNERDKRWNPSKHYGRVGFCLVQERFARASSPFKLKDEDFLDVKDFERLWFYIIALSICLII